MARRLKKLLTRTAIALAAACACGGALADPVSIATFAIATIGDVAATWLVVNAGTIALGAYGLVSSAQARRKQRKAASAARDASNASLNDRTQTVLSTEAPWQTVYGAPAPVGCAVAALLTSGAKDEFKHAVLVFASHPCEAISDILIEGVSIGPLSAAGWATQGEFVEAGASQTTEAEIAFNGAGVATLPGVVVQEILAATDPNPAARMPIPETTAGSTVYVSTIYAGRPVIVDYTGGALGDRRTQIVVAPNGAIANNIGGSITVYAIPDDGGPVSQTLPLFGEATIADVVGSVSEDGNIASRLRFEILSGADTRITGGRAGGTATVSYRYGTPRSFVRISKHLSPGGVDTADAGLIYDCPGQWTADHKLSGCTYIVMTMDLRHARFAGGLPTVTARLLGKKIYDPRSGVTGYSRNPALCLADFLQSEVGYLASSLQIDQAALIAAANACDEPAWASSDWTNLGSIGASPARYVCDGAFLSSQDREQTRQQLEDAMAGNSHESGGVWRISAGAWSTPVMHLTDDDMLGPVEVLQASNPGSGRYNGARGTYINQSMLGVSEDILPYVNPTYRASDGKDKWQDLAFAFTASHARTHHLAKIKTEQSRGGLVLKITPKMAAWRLQPGDRVLHTCAVFGMTAKAFRVQDWAYVTNAPVGLQLVEDEPSFYDLSDDTSYDPAPNGNLADPYAPVDPPAAIGLSSGAERLIVQGGVVIVRVLVTILPSNDSRVLQGGVVQVQWRRQSDSDDAWVSTDLAGDSVLAYLTGLPESQVVLVRVRFVTATLGIASPWLTQAHYVVGKTEPPPAITGVSLSIDRVFFAEIDRGAVPDLSGYLVRVIPGTVAQWSLGVPLHQGLVTDSPWFFPRRLYGVQTVMVAAVDDSGNVGMSGSATQDFGQPEVSAAIQMLDLGTASASVDPAADFWSIGGDFWVRDNAANFWGGSNYLPLVYTGRFLPAYGGGDVLLQIEASGSRVVIEYRIDGGTVGNFWAGANGAPAADFWGATGEFWGDVNDWQPWTGSVTSVRGQAVQWRVSIDGGPQQGVVSLMRAHLVMPLVQQVFPTLDVPSAGARLVPALGLPPRNWISIASPAPSVIRDGGAGVGVRVKEPNDAINGPVIEVLDNAGTPVAGRATAVVHGYEDVI